ncbi:MAG TPA: cupin domain-containing protein [Rhizomicrobium sp.]
MSAKKLGEAKITSLSAEGFFEPFAADDVPWQRVGNSDPFKRLGRYGGGSHVGVGLDVLKPGHFSNRFHYHLAEEEHIFILKGSATLHLGERRYVMKARDYCCFPAGQAAGHHLFNHTSENCVFLTIGENKPDDVAVFPPNAAGKAKAKTRTKKPEVKT